jgi:hypothetical protein
MPLLRLMRLAHIGSGPAPSRDGDHLVGVSVETLDTCAATPVLPSRRRLIRTLRRGSGSGAAGAGHRLRWPALGALGWLDRMAGVRALAPARSILPGSTASGLRRDAIAGRLREAPQARESGQN